MLNVLDSYLYMIFSSFLVLRQVLMLNVYNVLTVKEFKLVTGQKRGGEEGKVLPEKRRMDGEGVW